LPRSLGTDEVAKLSVLAQLDHLRTYPIVAEKLESGELSLAAWFFDVAGAELEEWSALRQRFVPIGDDDDERKVPAEHAGTHAH
jgi:carbonic anhydrase